MVIKTSKDADRAIAAWSETVAKVAKARSGGASPEEIKRLWWEAVEVLQWLCSEVPEARASLPPQALAALDVVERDLHSKAQH